MGRLGPAFATANAGPASPGGPGLPQVSLPPALLCLPRKGWQRDDPAPGPLGVMGTELLLPMSPHPISPPLEAWPPPWNPTHVLGSILAGLLWGQLSNQQGLQELAYKIEVLMEGAEGILRESQRSGGQAGGSSSTQRRHRRGGRRLTEGQGARGRRRSCLFRDHIRRPPTGQPCPLAQLGPPSASGALPGAALPAGLQLPSPAPKAPSPKISQGPQKLEFLGLRGHSQTVKLV